MKYNFSEKIFTEEFCKEKVLQVKNLISTGTSFTILGMRGVGMDTFLRYVALQNWADFMYLDIRPSIKIDKNELFLSLYKELGGNDPNVKLHTAFIACNKQLRKLLLTNKQIVILISRIDFMQSEFSNGLFASLKSLENINRGRIIFIISSIRPYYELDQHAFKKSNPAFVSKTLYFPPLSKSDLRQVLRQNVTPLRSDLTEIKQILKLSSGHIALLQLLLRTDSLDNPLNDEYIKIQLEKHYDDHSPDQKSQLRKIAAGKPIKELDPFLLKVGIVREVDGAYELFTPLLAEYINKYVQTKLPKKERLLFALLKKKLGKLVTKEEIITTVWGDLDVSDWAINSLIYRLRKSQTVKSSGFVIENDKSEGYRMMKET